MQSLRAIGLVLLALVVLPAVAFVAYEVVTLGEHEQMMTEVYDRQLETLLFSINQHAWDVSDAWADRLSRLHERHAHDPAALEAAVHAFLDEHAGLRAVVLADSLLRVVRVVTRAGEDPALPDVATVPAAGLLAKFRGGYRHLASVADTTTGTAADAATSDTATSDTATSDTAGVPVLLVFVPEAYRDSPVHLIGFAPDPTAFVEEVLVPKLQEVARATYRVGLFRAGTETPLYATGPPEAPPFVREEADRTRGLWVFPDHTVGIRPVGASIGELVRQRFYRNLTLVLGLAVLLLAAVYVVYRSIRRQVALARMKADFVSNVSHELRTPLALIRMYAETLEMGRVPTPARRQEYLRVIGQETERLTHLVNNILNFSRMEAGRQPYASNPVDLNDVVEDVHRRYAPTLEQQGFAFELKLADAVPAVRGDREAITEALLNLVDNAVKYSRDDRRITIETGAGRAGGAYVAVADRGIGIDAGEQHRIFEKFYRVSTGLVHETRGTGLGLAIVDHIVKAHGGRIGVESRPGTGSRFTLTFPADATAPGPAPRRAAAGAVSPSSHQPLARDV